MPKKELLMAAALPEKEDAEKERLAVEKERLKMIKLNG